MNDQPGQRPAEIDLAHAADFRLGAMAVRPSVREIAYDGARETLEPRVMQVLVALAEAAGAVVSRDDLIARCWEGRIVGEDAINRAIGRLRRLSEADDGASFAIETIPRVGYRLTVTGAALAAAAEGPPPAPFAPATAPSRRHLAILGSLAAILLVAAVAAYSWLSRPAEWAIDRFHITVATPSFENDPALSPNGAMIAYEAGPAPYAWHIFLRNLPDGQPIQLTNGASDDDLQPAWSPNSDHIAFIRHRDGQPCTIIVKPVPGGDERVVGHCRQDDFSSLAWNGDALYFSDRVQPQASRQIMRLDLSSGDVRPITFPPGGINGDKDPVFSPDGTKMIFLRASKGNGGFFLLDFKSGAVTQISATTGAEASTQVPSQSYAWIDNETLISSSGWLVEPTLWMVPLHGKAQRLSVNSQMLGRVVRGNNGVFAVETSRNQDVLASPPSDDHGTPQILQALSGVSVFPDYAADGRLAFAHADPGGLWEIWIQAPGEQAHPVTALAAPMISSVRWSPDGSRLAFLAPLGGTGRGLYLINPDGTGLRLLGRCKTVGNLVWAGDGQALLYPQKDTRGWRLWRMNLAHPERAAPFTDYGWFAVRVSGNAIYAMGTQRKGIWRIDGPKPQYIATLRKRCTEAFLECQAWLVQGDTLVFADHNDRARPQLIFHAIKDGTEHSIVAPGLNVTDMIALDPTTGRIAYVYDGLGDSDIALFHLSRR